MLQASLFQEQDREEKLPDPVIIKFSEEECENMAKRAQPYLVNNDEENYHKIMEYYPLPAFVLDRLKREIGIESLLKYRYNLYEAVHEYGEEWLND